jgi:hypothetical protein
METASQQAPDERQVQDTMKDPAGLLFSGKIKIFDPVTGEVFVEQRSE